MFVPICVHQLTVYQVPCESKILWSNVNQNTNITAIHDQWTCEKSGQWVHCFIRHDGKHIGPSHDMTWELAMVHGIWTTIS